MSQFVGQLDPSADRVAATLGRLILRDGLGTPSMRTLAKEMHCSAASLMNWFESKDRMLWMAAEAFRRSWHWHLAERVAYAGWPGFLPRDDNERDRVRVRRIWGELTALDDRCAGVQAGIVADEEDQLAYMLRRLQGCDQVAADVVTSAHATLIGLWHRTSATADPLADEQAQQIWGSLLS